MPEEYCPIIFTQEALDRNEKYVKCKGEKCAWWHEELKACVIMNLKQLQPK
ncbi:MAG: hypothetical protein WBC02_08320 [Candidatus Aminicenantaceae bacterium]